MFSWLPVYVAINNANRINRRRQEEKFVQKRVVQERVIYQLLLEGETDFMEIGTNETVSVVRICYGDYFSDRCCRNKWFANVNGEKIIRDTLSQCICSVMQIYNAKSIQLIPHSVEKEFGYVDSYMLMLKHVDVEKLNVNNAFKNIEEKMSEEIKTAW